MNLTPFLTFLSAIAILISLAVVVVFGGLVTVMLFIIVSSLVELLVNAFGVLQ